MAKKKQTQVKRVTRSAAQAVAPVAAAADGAPEPSFAIVGIGASAGGLAAIEAFFAAMPPDTVSGMAFVVVVRRSKPARCIRVQVPSSQGLANQIDPESCVQASNRLGEALTGERTGRVLSREKRTLNFRAPTDS